MINWYLTLNFISYIGMKGKGQGIRQGKGIDRQGDGQADRQGREIGLDWIGLYIRLSLILPVFLLVNALYNKMIINQITSNFISK